jgi:hypothetical protein
MRWPGSSSTWPNGIGHGSHQGHRAMGTPCCGFASSRSRWPISSARSALRSTATSSLAFTAGQEPGVLARGFASHVLWYLGYGPRPEDHARGALQARAVAHPLASPRPGPRRLAPSVPPGDGGNTAGRRHVGSRPSGFPFFLAQGTMLRGWALAEHGRTPKGRRDAPGPGSPRGDRSGEGQAPLLVPCWPGRPPDRGADANLLTQGRIGAPALHLAEVRGLGGGAAPTPGGAVAGSPRWR